MIDLFVHFGGGKIVESQGGIQYSPKFACPVSAACARASFSPVKPFPQFYNEIEAPMNGYERMCTNLALQGECRHVCERLLGPELIRQALRCFQNRIALRRRPSDRYDCLVEIFGCILDWCQCRCVVVNSRVDQDGPASGIGLWGRREVIYPAGLHVDGGNPSVVMFCQNSEFDGSAPRRWFQYRRDIVVSRSAITLVSSDAVSWIGKHLPKDGLRPCHHILPNFICNDYGLLVRGFSRQQPAHFYEFPGLS